jgi:hypothetical protein
VGIYARKHPKKGVPVMTATAQPKDRLSDEIIKILKQFGLPCDGMIRNRDLVKAGIFKDDDYHQQKRLQALGFPTGRWLGANTKVYLPEEIGEYLLNLPTKKPKLPRTRRAAAKSTKVETKRMAPKPKRQAVR